MTDHADWQLPESAARLYDQHVASWFEPWAHDLVERAGVRDGDHVLDLACGTGVVARAVGAALAGSGRLVGSDLSAEMLNEARARVTNGLDVVWREADMGSLPFADGEFDVVLCQQGLQFVPDKEAAVAEMLRVLRPGGRAAVATWCSLESNPYIAAMSSSIARHVSVRAGATMTAPASFGEAPDVSRLFVSSGFGEVEVEVVTLDRSPVDADAAIRGNLASLPNAAEIAAAGPERLDALVGDVITDLDEWVDAGVLTVPASSCVVIATR